jgi:hypothetical protein
MKKVRASRTFSINFTNGKIRFEIVPGPCADATAIPQT